MTTVDTMPLPVRLLQAIIQRFKYPVLVVGISIFLLLLIFFFFTGTLFPRLTTLPVYAMESTGLALLMSSLPAYLLMCLTAQVKSTPLIRESLKPLLAIEQQGLLDRLDQGRMWWLATLIGVIFASTSNINWMALSFHWSDAHFWWSIGTVTGAFIMWGCVGLMLYMKLYNGIILHRAGAHVTVELFNTERLNCFGRVGLNDLLIVVGAMALTPLQSIDQEFRWENYENAILVGVPSALLLVLLPIWSVHRRILRAKREEIALINAAIDKLPKTLEAEAVIALNSLLERRSYVQHLRSWPMDLSIFSRVVLYVLIPPLAWIGAAVMELMVDAYLQ